MRALIVAVLRASRHAPSLALTSALGLCGCAQVLGIQELDGGGSASSDSGSPNTVIALMQHAASAASSPQTSVQIALPNPQVAGDLNVVVVGWYDANNQTVTVTDSHNAYKQVAQPVVLNQMSDAVTQTIYYAAGIAGGIDTVTVGFSAPADSPDVRVLEYQGLLTTNPLDQAAGSSAVATTGSVEATTNYPNELIFVAGTSGASMAFGLAQGSPFTTRVSTMAGNFAADQTVKDAQMVQANIMAQGTSLGWVLQMATFH